MHRPEHIEAILRRAAQIEAERYDPAATLSDADLVAAGKAAGLSEDAVRQAIAEQQLGAALRPAADDGLRWTVSRKVPRLTDGQRAEMFSTFRRATPYRVLATSVEVETFGEAQQAEVGNGLGGDYGKLRVGPADADHDVWTYEHNAASDVMGLRWLLPIGGAFAGLLLALPLVIGLDLTGWVLVATMVFAAAAAGLFTPAVKRRTLAKSRRRFDALTTDLDRLATAQASFGSRRTEAAAEAARPALSLDALGDAPEAAAPSAPVDTRTRA